MVYLYSLDCFRGFSMLLVFLFHYNKQIMPRGYIGVDIFFIISGYINYLCSANIQSFMTFYTKRITRIYPLQIVCLFFIFWRLKTTKVANFDSEINNIMSSLLGFSNFHFYYVSLDYFQITNTPSYVLHFWSLSLESQFYLLFPFLLFLTKNIKALVGNYVIFICISLIESIYNSSYAYYSLSSRLNEFVLGMIISFPIIYSFNINKNIMLLILLIISSIDKKLLNICFPLPFLFLIEPIISYIIVKDSKSFLLENRILNYFGKISYSFYLFHYPILQILPIKHDKRIIKVFILVLIISSLFTYYIEKPIRLFPHQSILLILIIISSISFSLLLIMTKIKYKEYISSLLNDDYSKSNYMVQTPSDVEYNWSCNLIYKMCGCPFLKNQNIHNEVYIYKYIFSTNILFLLGDSHLEQWLFIMYPYARRMGYTLLELYCYGLKILSNECNWIFTLLHKFHNRNYAIVSNYLRSNQSEKLKKYLQKLLNIFNFIYVIQDTPHFPTNPNNCLIQKENKLSCFAILNINASIIKFPIVKNKRILYIDMDDCLCKKNICKFIYKGYPVYRDTNHLNLNYTYFLKEIFFNRGFKLKKLNYSTTLCNTAIWCRMDISIDKYSFCKNINI